MKQPRKKNVIAVLAGVAVAAAITASAATLGGIATDWLGANSNDVESPIDNGLQVSWDTSYDQQAKYYVVDDFTIETIDESESIPEGAEVKLALQLSSSDTPIELTGTVDAAGNIEVDGLTSVAAHDVVGVSVVVVGGGSTAADTDQP